MKKSFALATFTAATLSLTCAFTLRAQERPPGADGSKSSGKSRLQAILEAKRQRSPERMREQFEVKDDAEWSVIQTQSEKVPEARRATIGSSYGSSDRPTDPDLDALKKAVETHADAEDLKARMARLRESRKQKTAALEKAQEDLRQILTARQEAVALTLGLLK